MEMFYHPIVTLLEADIPDVRFDTWTSEHEWFCAMRGALSNEVLARTCRYLADYNHVVTVIVPSGTTLANIDIIWKLLEERLFSNTAIKQSNWSIDPRVYDNDYNQVCQAILAHIQQHRASTALLYISKPNFV